LKYTESSSDILCHALVCFCHNTAYILHIGINHSHWPPWHMHNTCHVPSHWSGFLCHIVRISSLSHR
jgi:hypothetical protein